MAEHSLEDLRIDRNVTTGRRSWPWNLVVGVLVIGAGVGWWWMGRPQVTSVRVALVTQRTASTEREPVLNASGYVTARRKATVSSKITGKIVAVLVEEGMRVEAGQVLARLDDSTVLSYLRLARAQLVAARGAVVETEVRVREAELTLGRTRQLVTQRVIGRAELDTAEAEVDSLKARLAQQREQVVVAERQVDVRQTELADTIVRAPFSGVAISKDAQPGEMVSPVSAGGGFTRTGISTIVDMDSLEIEVDVNESYINRVAAEQRVSAVLDAYPSWQIPGAVIAIVPAADRQKATVLVRIGFDELDPRILPNMGAKVAFLDVDEGEQAAADTPAPLTMPRAAVRDDDGQPVAFVVMRTIVERRAVRLGASLGDYVEVLAGLREGERVVVESPATLEDGDPVIVQGSGP